MMAKAWRRVLQSDDSAGNELDELEEELHTAKRDEDEDEYNLLMYILFQTLHWCNKLYKYT